MKEKMKFKWGQWIVFASFLIIGGFCGNLIVQSFDLIEMNGGEVSIFTFAVGILLLYAAIFLQIIIHELGHMLFGLMSGYKFSSFRIANFMWINKGGKLEFKRMSLPGTGGQCLMAPPGTLKDNIPYKLYNLGGSVLNLATAILFFLISIPLTAAPYLRLTLQMSAIMGLAYAIVNGVPMHVGAVDNDGYNAFSLGKDPQAVRSFWIQLKVSELQAEGYRLKDMPKEWFELPSEEAMLNSMNATIAVFATNRLMDEHRFEEAAELIDRLLAMKSGIVGLHRIMMTCDRICCELIGKNDPEVISKLLSKEHLKAMKNSKVLIPVMRTEYALALIHHKDNKTAEKIKNTLLKTMAKYPYAGEISSELEIMEFIENKN